MSESKLPIHGFILAGGKSSRMGADKATLEIHGRPMVEIALEKLRPFCADVSIAGNRDDLSGFAEVVSEKRIEAGPAAGIEAGLIASMHDWALFMPVDVPLVPAVLLHRWAEYILHTNREPEADMASNIQGAYLCSGDQHHPTFCLLRRSLLPIVSRELDLEHRSLRKIFEAVRGQFGVSAVLTLDATQFAPSPETSLSHINYWFLNVNTPDDLRRIGSN